MHSCQNETDFSLFVSNQSLHFDFVIDTPNEIHVNKKSNLNRTIDKHVGQHIRWFRVQRGLTQQQLARQLGISYQQLHKYEIGSNSVSASMLSQVSSTLAIAPDQLFEGVENGDHWLVESTLQEDMQLAHYYNQIRDPACRSALVTLVKSLAQRSIKH